MVDPNTQFQGRAQYMRGHEERGAGETAQSSATFDRPVSFDQFDAAVALNHRQDRWWNSLGAAGTVVHFSNPTVGGVPQDQSFRNGDIEAFPMRVGYVVAPFTSFFVEGALNRREFDLHEFDSRGCRVVGGTKHEKWRGPTGRASVLPRHSEIAWPLARKVCRDLKIPEPSGSR